MRLTTRRNFALLALASLVALARSGGIGHAEAADVDVLLELSSALGLAACAGSGWTEADKANYCSWIGITCGVVGGVTRVTGLYVPGNQSLWVGYLGFGYQENRPCFSWDSSAALGDLFHGRVFKECATGQLPQSIKYLDALKSFLLDDSVIWGDFPPEVFAFPSLEVVSIQTSGLNYSWPASGFSTKILHFSIQGGRMDGILPPSLHWPNVTVLNLKYLGLRCPIPVGLIPQMLLTSTEPGPACELVGNYFYLENDMICGQIPLTSGCIYSNLLPPPNIKPISAFPPATSKMESSKVVIEVRDSVLSFFPKMRSGSIFREEYFEISFQDWHQCAAVSCTQGFHMTPFGAVLEVVPSKQWKVNTTFYNSRGSFDVEWTFYLDPVGVLDDPMFKFELTAYKTNITWDRPNLYNQMWLNFNLVYRAPHSTYNSTINCVRSHQICNSDILNLEVTLPHLLEGDYAPTTTVTTNKTKIVTSFPTTFKIDGVAGKQLFSDVKQWFDPLGLGDFILFRKHIGGMTMGQIAPLEDQYFSLNVDLAFPIFNHTIEYDPSVSIALLTELNDGPASAEVQSAAIGIAVGVTIAAVAVVIAGVTLYVFREKIFPYRKDTDSQLETILEDDASPGTEKRNSAWVQGKASQKS